MVDVIETGRPDAVRLATRALDDGAVIGIPTDTVYGVAALPSRPDATAALFELKGRAQEVPIAVLCADAEQALALADPAALTPSVRAVAANHWPGPLTIVLPRRPGAVLHLGEPQTTIGLRCPDDDVVRAIATRSGPIATTSANPHGQPPATTAAQVAAYFGDGLALVLDGGERAGVPSTVLDAQRREWDVLRVGAVSLEALRATASRAAAE